MYQYPDIRRGLIKTGDGEDANYFQVYETRWDDLNWERWSLFGLDVTDDGGKTWRAATGDESSASPSLPAADQD